MSTDHNNNSMCGEISGGWVGAKGLRQTVNRHNKSQETKEGKKDMNNGNTQMQGFKMLAIVVATIALWAGSGPVTQATVLSMTVLQDDFSSYPTLNPGWAIGGASWGISGSYDSYVVQSGGSVGTLTRALSETVNTNWSVELRYGWAFGSADTFARDTFAMLDASGNGYGVYIEQAARHMIIQRFDGGGVLGSSVSLSAGNSKTFDDYGFFEVGGALRPLTLDWQASTGTLSLYYGAAGGPAGSASTLLASVTDTTYSSFTQFQLGDINAGGYYSVFDDVLVTAVPEPTSIALAALGAGFVLIRRRTMQKV